MVSFLGAPASLAAQDSTRSLSWRTQFTLYADNTEFFNPYRAGETLLGGNFWSWLNFGITPHSTVRAGLFFDHRSGDDKFATQILPVISYRYTTDHDLGVLGTLETVRRHGYLAPLEVLQLDITRPVEYGGQWITRRKHFDGEVYINWQVLNTPSSREVFDYGWLLTAKPVPWAQLNWQTHGLHRGGQLFDIGPVRNNYANGLGLRLEFPVPTVKSAYVWGYKFWSSGNASLSIPDSVLPGGNGHGTYLQTGIRPAGFDIYGIWWWGNKYLANEGDPNYNSIGRDTVFKADRFYFELGFLKHLVTKSGIGTDFELRFHQIDHRKSIAIDNSTWEYSYRIMVRVPFDLLLWKEKKPSEARKEGDQEPGPP
ncbi:MAG TPA: hypothetical protein VLT17_13045 [Gemmatimonadales bacterium]|nr:hypothetical protein [Gemmatimonadales bacterium]